MEQLKFSTEKKNFNQPVEINFTRKPRKFFFTNVSDPEPHLIGSDPEGVKSAENVLGKNEAKIQIIHKKSKSSL
jgi:hypothetical protein